MLVSLPDEIACEDGSSWVFQPSLLILPPRDMLLVALRFAGLSVTAYPSLSTAKQAGGKLAILSVLMQDHVRIMDPREFYVERTSFFQRVKDGYTTGGEPSNGTSTKVVATLALQVTLVDLTTGQILWRGPMQQSAENVVAIPPFGDGDIRVAGGAGIGEFERHAYMMRSLVVQGYVQLSLALAQQIRDSLKKIAR